MGAPSFLKMKTKKYKNIKQKKKKNRKEICLLTLTIICNNEKQSDSIYN